MKDHPEKIWPSDWGSNDTEEDWRTVVPYVQAYNTYLSRKRSEAEAKGREKGPFLLGETLSMGYIYLISMLLWFQAGGQERLTRILAIGEGKTHGTSPTRDMWSSQVKMGYPTKANISRG